mmetsp:Transcript_8836/g.27434  ORF Transcript_8836/g.27434 Transcript_8836/m.27434 type:complete len:80 (-) Transcript_8836:536-775(-)
MTLLPAVAVSLHFTQADGRHLGPVGAALKLTLFLSPVLEKLARRIDDLRDSRGDPPSLLVDSSHHDIVLPERTRMREAS